MAALFGIPLMCKANFNSVKECFDAHVRCRFDDDGDGGQHYSTQQGQSDQTEEAPTLPVSLLRLL